MYNAHWFRDVTPNLWAFACVQLQKAVALHQSRRGIKKPYSPNISFYSAHNHSTLQISLKMLVSSLVTFLPALAALAHAECTIQTYEHLCLHMVYADEVSQLRRQQPNGPAGIAGEVPVGSRCEDAGGHHSFRLSEDCDHSFRLSEDCGLSSVDVYVCLLFSSFQN